MPSFLLKNFISLVSAEVFSKFITFVAFAYLAREFGASGFGYIEWAGAVILCTGLIIDQGFGHYGTREIAKDPQRTSELVAEIVTARFLFAAISYGALAVLAFILVEDRVLRDLLLIYGLSLWILPLLLQWVFKAYDRMHLVALSQLVRQGVFVTLVFLFVNERDDLYIVGLAEVAGVLSAALFCLWMFHRKFAAGHSWRPRLSRSLFRESMPIGLSQMFWVMKTFGATFVVGLLATAGETGYFAGAMRIYIALHGFVWLYYANLFPSLSRGWKKADGSFSRTIRNSMLVVVPLSLVGGGIWILLSPLAMTVSYGTDFLKGSSALQWLAGACIAAALSGHFRFGLIAAGFQKKEMWTAALGALAVVVAIPLFYLQAGISGAAAAVCFAEIILLLTTFMVSGRTIFKRGRPVIPEGPDGKSDGSGKIRAAPEIGSA